MNNLKKTKNWNMSAKEPSWYGSFGRTSAWFRTVRQWWHNRSQFGAPLMPAHRYMEGNGSAGVCSFCWNFEWTHKNLSSGATECGVWIGNCNVKVWKSTEHKLHKIWHSLKFKQNEHTPAMLVAKRSAGVAQRENLGEHVRHTPLPRMNKAVHSGVETQRRHR